MVFKVITRDSDSSKIYESLHQIVIHNTFGPAHKKSVEMLCEEISKNNPELKVQLMEEFKKVQEAYLQKEIKSWSRDAIKSWSQIVNVHKKQEARENFDNLLIPSIYEKIAVVMRAIKIFKGYEPREIQILSVLILLNSNKSKGRLTQINTGKN